MWFSSVLCWLNETRKSSLRQPMRTCRPIPEVLEDRTVPATVTVSNLNDFVNGNTANIPTLIADPGPDGISLREALQAANFASDPDTLTFQGGLTGIIPLTYGALTISRDVTIAGPGAGVLTVSGRGSRIFEVASNSRPIVRISGLTLANGRPGSFPPSEDGGAIFVPGNPSLTQILVLTDMVITGGVAKRGGGIFMGSRSRLTMENTTISGNFAGIVGGGLYLANNSSTAIRNSTISDNETGNSNGGGVAADGVDVLTVENTTISGNMAALDGGGIWFRPDPHLVNVPATVRNSTIAFNTADNDHSSGGVGGGLAIEGDATATLQSTLVADNAQGLSGAHPDISGAVTALNCLVENTAGTTFLIGSGNTITGADPRLGPLADNGGPTRTHALLAGSPAIDAGLDLAGQPTDQRGPGFARVVGPFADIGAFEVQPPPLPSPPPPAPAQIVAVAFKRKGRAKVRVTDAATGVLRAELTPFKGFRGRLAVQLIDVNGDGLLDLIVKAVINGKRKKKAYDAVTLAPLPPGRA